MFPESNRCLWFPRLSPADHDMSPLVLGSVEVGVGSGVGVRVGVGLGVGVGVGGMARVPSSSARCRPNMNEQER